MSIGNPRKFNNFTDLEKELNSSASLKKEGDNVRLYKNKDARIKKELAFTTKVNKSKLT